MFKQGMSLKLPLDYMKTLGVADEQSIPFVNAWPDHTAKRPKPLDTIRIKDYKGVFFHDDGTERWEDSIKH